MFKKFFSFLTNIGISNSLSPKEKKQIRLTNQIAVIALVSALPYYFIFITFNLSLAANMVWVVVLCFLFIFVFNYYNNYNIAKLLVISTQAIFFAFYSIYLGFESGAHLLFVPLAILPLILYPSEKQRNYRWLGYTIVLISISGMAMCHLLWSGFTIQIASSTLETLYIFAFITTFGLVLPQVNVFNQSEQKSAKKLQESNTKLNTTLIQLKESRDAQVMLTQHADYAKLVQSIAHEFKNPLQMLQGTAEIGLQKNPENKHFFETIISSVDRLNNVIQPLLIYLNKKKSYKFKIFNLVDIVDQIMLLSKANCKAKKIKLILTNSVKEVPYVRGDSQFIGQVIINLITNAIEAFDQDGGSITISLADDNYQFKKQSVPAIRMSILDTACGIDQAKLKTIFIPYESDYKTDQNLGLGLPIVARIIKDHNGLINIKSEINQGTTVSVWLPKGNQSQINENDNAIPFELDDSFFKD